MEDKRRDHFVAQTYLRRFTNQNGHLYVFNKENDSYFTPKPDKICCKRGWDILEHKEYKYILREMLQTVEPKFNKCVNNILKEDYSTQDCFFISWYLGILFTLNPSFQDTVKEWHKLEAKNTACMLIDNGTIDMPKKIEELLGGRHNFEVEVDPNYIKAVIMKNLFSIVLNIYNSPWIIIKNISQSDFITSDNPVSFMPCPQNSHIYPRFIPLDTKHILFLPPTTKVNLKEYRDFDGTNIPPRNWGIKVIETSETELFNIYTIGNAERFIIMQNENEEIKRLISMNKNTKVAMRNEVIPLEKGYYIVSSAYCTRTKAEKESDFEKLCSIFFPQDLK